jgi:hypothetical protein
LQKFQLTYGNDMMRFWHCVGAVYVFWDRLQIISLL